MCMYAGSIIIDTIIIGSNPIIHFLYKNYHERIEIMKNRKWAIKTKDANPMHVVLFVSRNKDNKNVPNYTERRMSFVTKNSIDDEYLSSKFKIFAEQGVPGETSRMYYSVNSRNEQLVYEELLHFLISNKDFNLCAMQSKLAGLAAKKENALSKKWMFDFDINSESELLKFCKDITDIDPNVNIETHKTPNGYAVITSRGFDTRELFKKWNTDDVSLKRDDMLCYKWITI